MAEKFKPGNTVRLKSGGPVMTVEGHTQGGRVSCRWFDPTGKLQNATFEEAVLDLES